MIRAKRRKEPVLLNTIMIMVGFVISMIITKPAHLSWDQTWEIASIKFDLGKNANLLANQNELPGQNKILVQSPNKLIAEKIQRKPMDLDYQSTFSTTVSSATEIRNSKKIHDKTTSKKDTNRAVDEVAAKYQLDNGSEYAINQNSNSYSFGVSNPNNIQTTPVSTASSSASGSSSSSGSDTTKQATSNLFTSTNSTQETGIQDSTQSPFLQAVEVPEQLDPSSLQYAFENGLDPEEITQVICASVPPRQLNFSEQTYINQLGCS